MRRNTICAAAIKTLSISGLMTTINRFKLLCRILRRATILGLERAGSDQPREGRVNKRSASGLNRVILLKTMLRNIPLILSFKRMLVIVLPHVIGHIRRIFRVVRYHAVRNVFLLTYLTDLQDNLLNTITQCRRRDRRRTRPCASSIRCTAFRGVRLFFKDAGVKVLSRGLAVSGPFSSIGVPGVPGVFHFFTRCLGVRFAGRHL